MIVLDEASERAILVSKEGATVKLMWDQSNNSRMVGSSVTGGDCSIIDCTVEMAVGLIERSPIVS